jgi:Family of unknown function (DUF5681)
MPGDDRDSDARRKPPAMGYDVGYGKPPKATRFQPGASGNPRGRPRGSRNRSPSASSVERMQAIVLQEAYRLVTVRDGDWPVEMPLFQAAMRSLAVNAAKGQPRALALLVSLVDRIEGEGRRDRREAFAEAVEYKVQMTRRLAEHRMLGLPKPPMLPHPDHLIIDPVAGSVVLRGPWTQEMKGIWDQLTAMRAELEAKIEAARTALRKRARDARLAAQLELELSVVRKIDAYLATFEWVIVPGLDG